MSEQSPDRPRDLLFAWLTPIETHVDKRIHRPKSPSPSSPLVRAKTVFRKTFSAGQKAQRHRQKVREAHEACWWLRAAGFPQYAQLYEDGHFPMNISKSHVEEDHPLLEQAEVDTLIRRLNILNRCSPQMEEVRGSKKNDQDLEVVCRPLSDQWLYHHKQRNWTRKPRHRWHSEGSEGEHHASASPLPSPTPPLLVSELRSSLTNLSREIKTYSFLPPDDLPPIVVDPPGATHYASTSTPSPSKLPYFPPAEVETISQSLQSIGSDLDSDIFYSNDHNPEGGSMENFASGLCSVFDSSLRRLRAMEQRSHSLPNVFSASQIIDTSCVSTTTDENTSTSISMASVLDDPVSLEEANLVSMSTPVVNEATGMNGHPEPPNSMTSSYCAPRGGVATTSVPVIGSQWPVQGNGACSYESGSEVGEVEKDRSRLSPMEGWGGLTLQQRRSSDVCSVEGAEPSAVVMRRKKNGGRHSKSRWHSFQKSHSYQQVLKPVRTMIPIEELSVGQISVLRKLSLVKLTAMLELYGSSVNIVRCLRRKPKLQDVRSRMVFGSSLSENVRRYGSPIPPTILHALDHLIENGLETVGVFRRAAGKSRVGVLRGLMESNPDHADFQGYSSYDISDLVKQFFRELSEPLLTVRFSELLLAVQETIPKPLRVQMIHCIMLLLPDENRDALRRLLSFLEKVAEKADVNQMDAKNLAVCFSPSLFSLSSSISRLQPNPSNRFARMGSLKRHTLNHSPSPMSLSASKEVTETVAASQSLQLMITHCRDIFKVAADQLQVVRFSYLELSDPVPFHELGSDRSGKGTHHTFLNSCVATMLKESRRKFKDWVRSEEVRGVELSYLKISDGIPLRLWRGVTRVAAPARSVLDRLWSQRHLWDKDIVSSRKVATIDSQTEVFQYVTSSMPPLSSRDHCVLRFWHRDVTTNSYVVVSTSVTHPLASLQAGVRAVQLATHYLLQSVEGGTQVTVVCRADWRGRSADYYNNSFGPYLASSIAMLRDSFSEPEFLETPV